MLNPKSRALKFFFILIGSLVVITVICLLAYWFSEMPRYIAIKIDPPIGDWEYTEYSTRIWSDSSNRYFLSRRETDVYGSIPGYRFDSIDQVLKYFDGKLHSSGWLRFQADNLSCSLLQESNFLEDQYLRQNHGLLCFDQKSHICSMNLTHIWR